MKKITEMNCTELLDLTVSQIGRLLTAVEVVHMAKTLDAFWAYDYEAQKAGRVGLHALLKSERHSDGFFVSKILLEPLNIRYIMSNQICMRLREMNIPQPDYVAGIPDGATKLGDEVTWMLGAKPARMEKSDGHICLVTPLNPGDKVLLIEDFCTRGTSFIEAVSEIKSQQPEAVILPYDPVIINRGGLKEVAVAGVGRFTVLPVVEQRVQDWEPADCPLCKLGSRAIKPKATDENWRLLNCSQV